MKSCRHSLDGLNRSLGTTVQAILHVADDGGVELLLLLLGR